jgi:outer membrane biosynthesis protein TonB
MGLAVMLTALAACEYLPFMASKPPPPKMEATPTPTPSQTPTPTPTETPRVRKSRPRRKHRLPAPIESETPAAEASPAAGAVITSGESAHAHGEIERSINRVEADLAKIKRNTLSTQDAADYDRIKGFIADARSALQEHDELRARSLADKAARLASQLAGHSSGP